MSSTQASDVAIEDDAVIGNCHTAALISREGSIDWWCPMRFDRPAVFAALLDTKKGGRFWVRPTQHYQVERRYVEHTNVLETTFQTRNGQCRLTDLMPLGVTDQPRTLQPHHAILHMVEGVVGEVEMALVYEPRFAYGRVTPRLYDRKRLGFWCAHAGEALTLYSDLPLNLVPEEGCVYVRFLVRRGDRRFAGLSFARGEPLMDCSVTCRHSRAP